MLIKRVMLSAGLVAAGWLYLPSRWVIIPLAVLSYRLSGKWLSKREAARRKEICTLQTVGFLETLAAHLGAGYNPYFALSKAAERMSAVYGEDAWISEALGKLCRDYQAGVGLESCLQHLSDGSGFPEMATFVSHFAMGIRQGCNLAELSAQFAEVFSDEYNLKHDRRTAFSGAIREQRMLLAMPVLLLAAMRGMRLTPARLSAADAITRLVCAALFVGAQRLSARIIGDHHEG